MATREDISFNRVLRVMTVAAPSTTLTIQDLYDTIRDWEDEPGELDQLSPARAAGKDPLGGGESVGITLVLINDWRIAFEARTTAAESGSATSASGDGTTLVDTGADFVTAGVQSGSIVVNKTDGSMGTVTVVVDQFTLTLDGLTGGAENDWDISDDYDVYNVISCVISGGNLIGDNTFADNPIFPTFATQVQIRQSSAPVQLVQATTRASGFVFGG